MLCLLLSRAVLQVYQPSMPVPMQVHYYPSKHHSSGHTVNRAALPTSPYKSHACFQCCPVTGTASGSHQHQQHCTLLRQRIASICTTEGTSLRSATCCCRSCEHRYQGDYMQQFEQQQRALHRLCSMSTMLATRLRSSASGLSVPSCSTQQAPDESDIDMKMIRPCEGRHMSHDVCQHSRSLRYSCTAA